MLLENAQRLIPDRVGQCADAVQVEDLGEALSPGHAGGEGHQVVGRAEGSERRGDGDQWKFAERRGLPHLHAVAQSAEQFGDRREFPEEFVHDASPDDKGPDGLGVALGVAGKHIPERGERVRRVVGDHGGEGGCDVNGLPAPLGLHGVYVFPLIEPELDRNGFERGGEIGPEVERFDGDPAVEFLEFLGVPVSAGDGFLADALHVVAEEAARAEQRGKGFKVSAQAGQEGLGECLGGGAQLEDLVWGDGLWCHR